jgi:hypothetical protein
MRLILEKLEDLLITEMDVQIKKCADVQMRNIRQNNLGVSPRSKTRRHEVSRSVYFVGSGFTLVLLANFFCNKFFVSCGPDSYRELQSSEGVLWTSRKK